VLVLEIATGIVLGLVLTYFVWHFFLWQMRLYVIRQCQKPNPKFDELLEKLRRGESVLKPGWAEGNIRKSEPYIVGTATADATAKADAAEALGLARLKAYAESKTRDAR
jgi:hypothetical protein